MRFTVTVLGTEVLAISTNEPNVGQPAAHDTNCSQVELAGDVAVGFHIQPNPSLDQIAR